MMPAHHPGRRSARRLIFPRQETGGRASAPAGYPMLDRVPASNDADRQKETWRRLDCGLKLESVCERGPDRVWPGSSLTCREPVTRERNARPTRPQLHVLPGRVAMLSLREIEGTFSRRAALE